MFLHYGPSLVLGCLSNRGRASLGRPGGQVGCATGPKVFSQGLATCFGMSKLCSGDLALSRRALLKAFVRLLRKITSSTEINRHRSNIGENSGVVPIGLHGDVAVDAFRVMDRSTKCACA